MWKVRILNVVKLQFIFIWIFLLNDYSLFIVYFSKGTYSSIFENHFTVRQFYNVIQWLTFIKLFLINYFYLIKFFSIWNYRFKCFSLWNYLNNDNSRTWDEYFIVNFELIINIFRPLSFYFDLVLNNGSTYLLQFLTSYLIIDKCLIIVF